MLIYEVNSETKIHAQSQRLFSFSPQADTCSHYAAETLIFEPILPYSSGCLIARSVNLKSSESLYCNVINATDSDIVFKKGLVIGKLSEAEMIDEKFDEEVYLNFNH